MPGPAKSSLAHDDIDAPGCPATVRMLTAKSYQPAGIDL